MFTTNGNISLIFELKSLTLNKNLPVFIQSIS